MRRLLLLPETYRIRANFNSMSVQLSVSLDLCKFVLLLAFRVLHKLEILNHVSSVFDRVSPPYTSMFLPQCLVYDNANCAPAAVGAVNATWSVGII